MYSMANNTCIDEDQRLSSLDDINIRIKYLRELKSEGTLSNNIYDFMLRYIVVEYLEKELNNKYDRFYSNMLKYLK
jgi:hypothetical protein